MKIFLFILGYTSLFFTACSQQDTAEGFLSEVTFRRFAVGRSAVTVRSFTFEKETPFLLIQLHSNETTAADVAYEAAHRWGIHFIQILNKQSRLVPFERQGKTFHFDPNRIFSEAGIKKTLQLSGRYTDAAFRDVQRFSDSFLMLLPPDKPVVAVHNNTDGRFTILQYDNAGIGQVHVNEEQDEDDFFITNDEEIFRLLKEENFNVVLEDASKMKDDGSLILYCSRENIRYINVEAQHGHRQEQEVMLETVRRILN